MSRLLHQRMLEGVERVGQSAALENQFRGDEPSESGLQLLLGKAGDIAQQRVRKLAPYCSAYLRQEPRRQQIVQTRRDREWRQSTVKRVTVCLLAQQAAFQNALRQFLNKQRHAICTVDDLGDDLIRQGLAAGDFLYKSSPVDAVQAIELEHRHLRLSDPVRLELGAEGHDQQNRQAAHSFDSEVEHFARGRVDPMRVLEHHQQRLSVRQPFELSDQRLQYLILLALRTAVRQRVGLRNRQGHEIGEERHIVIRQRGEAQQGFEFLQS